MTTYGYARTSTVGQDNGLETQKQLLKEAGCANIYHEQVTGTSTDKRSALKELLEAMSEGDTLVVTKIDRLARSIIDLNSIVNDLLVRGINVKFLKDNLHFEAVEKRSPMQDLMFNMLGAFAQFERDLIVDRTTEGRERAKAKGTHMGRPALDSSIIKRALKLYAERESNGLTVSEIIKSTGIPKATLYVELKKLKNDK
ncbi:recombinase family protein [Cohnella soli]|uniref:Recombinase family protein n=1 Tax=Cohnella soli TaxID=425005 RepID=A0ABW0HSF0_9BACL